MLRSLAQTAGPFLELPPVRRTRQNHGLEHATITILSSRIPNLRMAGRSDANGFYLWGDAPQEEVERAIADALRRMKQGEGHLAIHPNCGTNLVTQGTLVSLAALIGSVGTRRGVRDYLNRLPLVLVLSLLAILFGQPLGMRLQEHFTTTGDLGDLSVIEVRRFTSRGLFSGADSAVVTHRVVTRSR